ncbi:MAG: tetratricopeptide repeat protein, partial [Cyanobacteria bacterium J06600_6]
PQEDSEILVDSAEQAEQEVLQGMNAERQDNLKQAIAHYRQALEYFPESFQARQLLTTALMKVHDRHQAEVKQRHQQATEDLKPITESTERLQMKDLRAEEIPAEIVSPQPEPNFINLGLVNPAPDNHSSIELVPQKIDQFVLLPSMKPTAEESLPSEEILAAEVYLGQALAYFEQKQWELSIAACKEALRVHPKMGAAYKIWGNCLQRGGKSTEAIGIYAKALEAKADMAEIYCNLGSIYAKQKKWQQAIEHYQKSTIINSNNATPYRNLAKVWDELGEYDKSADCFFQALDIQPDLLSAKNHFSLANNLIAEGNIARAIASYKSCVELEPNFLNAYARLADALEATGQPEAALFYYKKLAQLQTEKQLAPVEQSKSSQQISSFLKPNGSAQKALPPSSAKQSVKALPQSSSKGETSEIPQLKPGKQTRSAKISAYLQAAARQPNSAQIQFELGNLFAQDKQWQTAVTYYQQAVKLAPQSAKYHLKLAQVWEQLNDPLRANLAFYEAFSLRSPKVSAKNHYLLGDKLLQHQETKRAIACYRRAVSIKSDFIEAYWRLGEISLTKGNHKTALACYHRALKIEPNRVQSYILLGKALAKYSNWQAALSYYQKAVVLEPKRADIYCSIGESLVNLQRYEEAATALHQGIGKDPMNWQLYYQLGNVCSQQNLWKEAVGAYEKAVVFNPRGFDLLQHYLGQAYLELQEWSSAADAFQKAIELNSTSSWSYYGLGSALSELSQWQAAAAALSKSLELNSDFDWAHHKLGNAKAELQDWDGAVQAYRAALKITPDLPKTESRLNDMLRKRSMSDLEQVTEYYQTSLEREPESESAYFKALEVSPNDPAIYTKLAALYQSQGNSAQAIAFYKIALQIQPDNSEAAKALEELQSPSV